MSRKIVLPSTLQRCRSNGGYGKSQKNRSTRTTLIAIGVLALAAIARLFVARNTGAFEMPGGETISMRLVENDHRLGHLPRGQPVD
jgi:hypothetical protein